MRPKPDHEDITLNPQAPASDVLRLGIPFTEGSGTTLNVQSSYATEYPWDSSYATLNTPTWVSSSEGYGLKCVSGTSQHVIFFDNSILTGTYTAVRGTILTRFRIDVAITNSILGFGGVPVINGSLSVRGNATLGLWVGINSNVSGYKFTSATTGVIYTLITSWGEQGFYAWLDGTLGDVSAGTPSTDTSSVVVADAVNTHFGLNRVASVYGNSTHYCLCFWETQLNQSQRNLLFDDPYLPFRQPTYTLQVSFNNLQGASGSSTDEQERARYKGNEVNLTLNLGGREHGGSYTDWEIRPEHTMNSFTVRTNNQGVIGQRVTGNVTQANLTMLSITLDRTINYYARVRIEDENWTEWCYIDLSGEIRTITGKHRSERIITNTSRGATVQTTNPLWTEQKTSRGVTVTNYVYAREKSRKNPNE